MNQRPVAGHANCKAEKGEIMSNKSRVAAATATAMMGWDSPRLAPPCELVTSTSACAWKMMRQGMASLGRHRAPAFYKFLQGTVAAVAALPIPEEMLRCLPLPCELLFSTSTCTWKALAQVIVSTGGAPGFPD